MTTVSPAQLEAIVCKSFLQIFLHLPAKSLCRFRSVSKSCQHMIADAVFVRMHLKTTQRQRLAILTNHLYSIDLETISCDFDQNVADAVEHDLPFNPDPKSGRRFRLFGSCNGLLCLHINNDFGEGEFVIYNPTIKEHKIIPQFTPDSVYVREVYGHECPYSLSDIILYGFGYIESRRSDDYRFVKVDIKREVIHIFSLKTNSWSWKFIDLENFIYGDISPVPMPGTPLNNAIHWVCNYKNKPDTYLLVAFDLKEEKFKNMDWGVRINESIYTVGVVRDCLCLLQVGLFQYKGKLRVMNEYGVDESWTTIFIPEPFTFLHYLRDSDDLMVLVSKEYDELLVCDSDGILKDLKVNGFKQGDDQWIFYEQMLERDEYCPAFRLQMYTETLVSPNFGTPANTTIQRGRLVWQRPARMVKAEPLLTSSTRRQAAHHVSDLWWSSNIVESSVQRSQPPPTKSPAPPQFTLFTGKDNIESVVDSFIERSSRCVQSSLQRSQPPPTKSPAPPQFTLFTGKDSIESVVDSFIERSSRCVQSSLQRSKPPPSEPPVQPPFTASSNILSTDGTTDSSLFSSLQHVESSLEQEPWYSMSLHELHHEPSTSKSPVQLHLTSSTNKQQTDDDGDSPLWQSSQRVESSLRHRRRRSESSLAEYTVY